MIVSTWKFYYIPLKY